MSDIAYIDIYPPIAVARVGDSEEWYIGPEIPGFEPMPGDGFKDSQHKIRRCAPRFRVYAFNSQGKAIQEINLANGQVKWSVHVANKKSAWVKFRGQYREESWVLRNPHVQPWPKDEHGQDIHTYTHCDTRSKLIIDSGMVSISGEKAEPVELAGQFWGSKTRPVKVHLGAVHTDELGRLIIVAGDGHAYQMDSTGNPEDQPFLLGAFDNNDWIESMFDGHVFAEATIDGKLYKCKNRATILSAPPHYAHGHHCPTTLYELIEDVYEQQGRHLDGYDVGEVDFYKHINPLFERMYRNSWSNFRANEGHGPRRAHLWLDNEDLSNPDTTNTRLREYIFDRVRAPVVKLHPDILPTPEQPIPPLDPKNRTLREQQAYMYWMPRLGGNDSDMPEQAGDPNNENRWTSLTQLQHDRLQKWSKGIFVTGTKPKIPASFDDIRIEDQPHALRFAALEWSVGAPLYPGIECFWVAEFGQMYDLKEPFRFGERAAPGDLTRGLALPWHADFYMCNTHWWPSVRPDDVVTEDYFGEVRNNFQHELHNLSVNLTKRVRWDNGLDVKLDQGDERYGNSEMVRKWFKLGFISKIQYGPESEKKPIAIEVQRYPGFSRVPKTSEDPVPPPKDSQWD